METPNMQPQASDGRGFPGDAIDALLKLGRIEEARGALERYLLEGIEFGGPTTSGDEFSKRIQEKVRRLESQGQ